VPGQAGTVWALRRLNEALEHEIQRMALAVHDEAGQLLVAARLAISALARDLGPSAKARVEEVCAILDRLEADLRQLSHELRPTILDDLGLVPALEFLAAGVSKRAGLSVRVESSLRGRPAMKIETTLYRIVQEALANAAKHARAGRVEILLAADAASLHCVIRDDGTGFDARAVLAGAGQHGLGLIGIRERLSAVGGTLQIQSERGRGTELRVRIPMET
jgi:signal transduction histidine kinase